MADELDRLFEILVESLHREARLAVPFPANELHERLVPYRSSRSRLRVATYEDYEMAVLRLLAGERDYLRLEPETAIVRAKMSGPKIPANFSKMLKNPKNSPDLCCGIMLAKSERLSAWVPPCTMPTRPARMKKCVADVMK